MCSSSANDRLTPVAALRSHYSRCGFGATDVRSGPPRDGCGLATHYHRHCCLSRSLGRSMSLVATYRRLSGSHPWLRGSHQSRHPYCSAFGLLKTLVVRAKRSRCTRQLLTADRDVSHGKKSNVLTASAPVRLLDRRSNMSALNRMSVKTIQRLALQ